MEIEIIEGRYTDKVGVPVTIISTSARGDYPIKAITHNRNFDGISAFKSLDDLVKIPSLEDLKIDDRVLVKDSRDEAWLKRHFSGISEDGKCLAFGYGTSSWTSCQDDAMNHWNYWKLPVQGEV